METMKYGIPKLSERDHIQIALQVQLRKALGSWQNGEPRLLDIRTARLVLAELADGRPWIAKYFEQRTERAFERIARAALREVEKEPVEQVLGGEEEVTMAWGPYTVEYDRDLIFHPYVVIERTTGKNVAAFRTSAEAWQHAEALNKKES